MSDHDETGAEPAGEGAPGPELRGDDFVARLVSDPKNPPQAMLLSGYLGASDEEGHTRVYFNPELSDYVDVPNGDILHTEQQGEGPLATTLAWIKRDSQVLHGQAGAARQRAGFFEGRVWQENFGATAAAQGGAYPAMAGRAATVGCTEVCTAACASNPICRTDACIARPQVQFATAACLNIPWRSAIDACPSALGCTLAICRQTDFATPRINPTPYFRPPAFQQPVFQNQFAQGGPGDIGPAGQGGVRPAIPSRFIPCALTAVVVCRTRIPVLCRPIPVSPWCPPPQSFCPPQSLACQPEFQTVTIRVNPGGQQWLQGSGTGADTVNYGSGGTGADTVNYGSGGTGADTVNYGSGGTGTDTVNYGSGGGTDTVIYGSTGGTDTVYYGSTGGTDTVIYGSTGGTDTVYYGSTGGTDTVNYGSGGGADTVHYGSGGGTDTVWYGSGTGADTVNYGSGMGTDTVWYGSGTGTDTVWYGSGTGTDTVWYGQGSGGAGILPTEWCPSAGIPCPPRTLRCPVPPTIRGICGVGTFYPTQYCRPQTVRCPSAVDACPTGFCPPQW